MSHQTPLSTLQTRLSYFEKLLSTAQTTLSQVSLFVSETETLLEEASLELFRLKKRKQIGSEIEAAQKRVTDCEQALEAANVALVQALTKVQELQADVIALRVEIDEYHNLKSEETAKSEQVISGWRQQVNAAFADYSRITVFPAPPQIGLCSSEVACAAEARLLKCCRCQIEFAFRDVQDLKKERTMWHPDKFSSCPEELRKDFQKMAREVFVVVDDLYRRSRR